MKEKSHQSRHDHHDHDHHDHDHDHDHAEHQDQAAEPSGAKAEKNQTPFRCQFCSQEFGSLTELKDHKNAVHPSLAANLAELEKIKSEIIKEIRPEKSHSGVWWGSAAVSAILVLLALFSVAQAFETYAIWQKINSGAIPAANAQGTAAPAAPASLDSQPNMVGGC